jgi:hypothetical protein
MNNELHKIEEEFIRKQKEICERHGALYTASPFDKIIGVAIETFEDKGVMPIYGVRLPTASDDSATWYIYAGEYSAADDFYKPMHIGHLLELCPQVLQYLGLPPGWRFLFDDKGYEDVWCDEEILNG